MIRFGTRPNAENIASDARISYHPSRVPTNTLTKILANAPNWNLNTYIRTRTHTQTHTLTSTKCIAECLRKRAFPGQSKSNINVVCARETNHTHTTFAVSCPVFECVRVRVCVCMQAMWCLQVFMCTIFRIIDQAHVSELKPKQTERHSITQLLCECVPLRSAQRHAHTHICSMCIQSSLCVCAELCHWNIIYICARAGAQWEGRTGRQS